MMRSSTPGTARTRRSVASGATKPISCRTHRTKAAKPATPDGLRSVRLAFTRSSASRPSALRGPTRSRSPSVRCPFWTRLPFDERCRSCFSDPLLPACRQPAVSRQCSRDNQRPRRRRSRPRGGAADGFDGAGSQAKGGVRLGTLQDPHEANIFNPPFSSDLSMTAPFKSPQTSVHRHCGRRADSWRRRRASPPLKGAAAGRRPCEAGDRRARHHGQVCRRHG